MFEKLDSGGLYVIEDVTQFSIKKNPDKISLQQLPIHGEDFTSPLSLSSEFYKDSEHFKVGPYVQYTTSSMLAKYCFTREIHSPFMYPWEVDYLNEHISYVNIHPSKIFNLNICFIGKK